MTLPLTSRPTLYDPQTEHDGCGVGVVANIKGRKTHEIVLQGLEVLQNLAHRGASGSDPETGDGAGILIQMPDAFMRREAAALGITLPPQGEYAVGMVFLPQGDAERHAYESLLEEVIEQEGQFCLAWRDVPVNDLAIGRVARECQPRIRQIFVARGPSTKDESDFERKLYVIRKLVERKVLEAGRKEADSFYVPSFSTNRIVYKGLLIGTQLQDFYRDLSDAALASSFVLVHSRFSTNTLGSWKLAHPYRHIVHNGEINTLRGNTNWMVARQGAVSSPLFGDAIEKLFPIITPGASDTASIDNTIEFLLASGRSLPHVMMMLIPEAWGDHLPMDQEKRDFYEYHSFLMEPWDGPALIAFTDGLRVGAILDRNGLRPFRYLVTQDDLLVMASEVGVLDVPPEKVLYKGRIQPGRMFLLDPEQGGIIDDTQLKRSLSRRRPYGQWLQMNRKKLADLPPPDPSQVQGTDTGTLVERQRVFGYTQEELSILMEPMATRGTESIGSMGTDVPLAVLSQRPQPLFNYFKQCFAQVSNPPLDAMREELVTSLVTPLGSEQNLLDETPEHARQLELHRPILSNAQLEQIRSLDQPGLKTITLPALFHVDGDASALEQAMETLCKRASEAIELGYTIIIISDRGVDATHAPIPSLLSTSGVHHHLIRQGTRTRVGLVVETGEPREVAHFALLISYGAGAVNPYLAFETLDDMGLQGILGDSNGAIAAEENYIKAIGKGLLKIASKMGISTIQSYRGAQIFEAVGLGKDLIERYFTWTPSRIGGIGIETIQQETLQRHHTAYSKSTYADSPELNQGGNYYWRRDGEYHMWNPEAIEKLQYAVKLNDRNAYREFAVLADEYERELCTLRGLFEFQRVEAAIPLEEVEPAREIVKRLATGGVSLGAISREAHETLAIAMNRIGARSNSGEGGEDYHRYVADPNGDRRHSAIKQVASGRFGVTINYLVNASDLQIKMAQGSKPGEGGQLPGHKVDEYIGWVRRSTPGVELISPPPHHDIYSIEDLAQLIHDLKNANSSARIHVKLVAEMGVGTIAAGVSKAHADVVLISGDSGGTGASPDSSIKHAGLPWELGVAETQQVLVQNDLRGRIVVQTDGQIKTGRDVAIACLLGAEEFGIATAALITLGCIMLRKCHLNTCSVGIATQDPELRGSFTGQPEHLINYFYFIAEELREIMASLGFRTVDQMVGRVDKLDVREAIDHWKTQGLDLSSLLARPEAPAGVATHHTQDQDHGLERALDHQLIALAKDALNSRAPVEISLPIRNSNRTVGTMLSSEVARRYGEEGLPPDTVRGYFKGSAGQSFAAFLAKGISFTLEGDANDYFGKGISGGRLVVFPPKEATFVPEANILTGNVNLYGATSGDAYIRGIAGERFCVRNSGVEAVVEGIGDHGCEYMTGGTVVVLGSTGRNFAAGMSGGIAYVLDRAGDFSDRCNRDMVNLYPVEEAADIKELRRLIENHHRLTGSTTAKGVLDTWDQTVSQFVKVFPKDYQRILEARSRTEREAVAGG
jgi:glutamate synthase (NADPH/NADH) large chain